MDVRALTGGRMAASSAVFCCSHTRATAWLRAGLLASAFLGAGVVRSAPSSAAPPQPTTQHLNEIHDLFRAGKYAEAETRARPLLAAAEASSGPRSLEVADVLDLLVRVLDRSGEPNHPDLLAFAKRAVAIREALPGPADPKLAASLNNLGMVHYSNWHLDQAEALFKRSLDIRRKTLGPNHPDVAESLESMGLLQAGLGHHHEALKSLERALEIREWALGPDHLDVAESLNSLAGVRYGMGDYSAAELLYARASEIRERALGGGHPAVAVGLHNLGAIHQVQGDYAGARTLYERAMKIRLSALSAEHPSTLSTHNALATLLQITGDYAGARMHYQKALDGQAKRLGKNHPSYAHTLCSMALLLHDSGDFREAEVLQRQALEIRRKALGPAHPDVAFSLTWLGHLLLRQGDSAGARTLFEEALSIQEQALDPDHPHLADTLIGLAGSLEAAGDLPAARRLLERSLVIYEKTYGPTDPALIMPLTELAEVLELTGDFTGARHLNQRALQAAGKFPGAEFHRTAEILHDDAILLARLGRLPESLEVALRGEALAREHVSLTARSLPERQALAYAAHMKENLDVVLSIVTSARPASAEERKQGWNALIRSRALVLDEMGARHRTLSSKGDPEIERLSGELRAARQDLANLVVRGPVGLPADHYAKLAADARQRRERAEEALAGRSPEFLGEQSSRQIDFDDVSSALPARNGLVAYVLFNRMDLSRGGASSAGSASLAAPTPTYLAFVAGPGREPVMVLLGAAAEIDRCVQDWKREASGGSFGTRTAAAGAETAYRHAAETLREKIWDPIAISLRGAERVFVVPDGNLNLVNLAALPVGAGDYLVDTGPEIHLLSAERDLVPRQSLAGKGTGLLAMGGADFDDRSGFAARGAPSAFQGQRMDCSDFQSVSFSPLPVTAREIDEVISLWPASGEKAERGTPKARGSAPRNKETVVHLTGADANEKAFKTLAPGRCVLHLATHGFFFNGRCIASTLNVRGIGGVGVPQSASANPFLEENPLLLSGLALAGANHRAQAGPGEEDGILTSEEIASLDLAGVEWAVLSACDTGIGEIRAGEGVFGLRRAFRIAGARTVVMSLWSVEDRAASVWMKALYESRLVEGLDTSAAVRKASRTVLELRRARGESSHPFFWAGFVASGDWK